jgi:hypothetical protein
LANESPPRQGLPHVEPWKRAEQRVKDPTARRPTPLALEDMIGEVNHALRGWARYFRYRDC